jgi:hypothetical protein
MGKWVKVRNWKHGASRSFLKGKTPNAQFARNELKIQKSEMTEAMEAPCDVCRDENDL